MRVCFVMCRGHGLEIFIGVLGLMLSPELSISWKRYLTSLGLLVLKSGKRLWCNKGILLLDGFMELAQKVLVRISWVLRVLPPLLVKKASFIWRTFGMKFGRAQLRSQSSRLWTNKRLTNSGGCLCFWKIGSPSLMSLRRSPALPQVLQLDVMAGPELNSLQCLKKCFRLFLSLCNVGVWRANGRRCGHMCVKCIFGRLIGLVLCFLKICGLSLCYLFGTGVWSVQLCVNPRRRLGFKMLLRPRAMVASKADLLLLQFFGLTWPRGGGCCPRSGLSEVLWHAAPGAGAKPFGTSSVVAPAPVVVSTHLVWSTALVGTWSSMHGFPGACWVVYAAGWSCVSLGPYCGSLPGSSVCWEWGGRQTERFPGRSDSDWIFSFVVFGSGSSGVVAWALWRMSLRLLLLLKMASNVMLLSEGGFRSIRFRARFVFWELIFLLLLVLTEVTLVEL